MSPEEQLLRVRYSDEYAAYDYVRRRCGPGRAQLDPRWTSFANFVEDMGRRPTKKHTVGLIDPLSTRFGPGTAKWMSQKDLADRRRALKRSSETTVLTSLEAKLAEAARQAAENKDRLFSEPADGFRPWQYQGTEPVAKFNMKYRHWRAKVDPRFAALALPEVYYFLSRSIDLLIVIKRRENGQYNESQTGSARRPSTSEHGAYLKLLNTTLERELNAAFISMESKSPGLASLLANAQSDVDGGSLRQIAAALTGNFLKT